MFSESGFPWNRVRVRTPELHTPVWNLTECPPPPPPPPGMEHIICSNLMSHLDHHKILTDHQFGFQKKRSCETQLLITINELAKSLDGGKQIDCILLDFSKAFDKVSHKHLIIKLQHYGVQGPILRWIETFLADCTQEVIVKGEHSDIIPVTSGVPQGTVLGPALFLVYINDLPEWVSSTLRLFADDCLLYREINNQSDTETLQQDLDNLQHWEKTWLMEFAEEKCQILQITKKYKRNTIMRDYSIHGYSLQAVQEGKYLGVTLQGKLSFTPHINNIVKMATTTRHFLQRNLRGCSKDVKDTSYRTFVRPLMEYASTVWDPVGNKASQQKLEAEQNRCARFVVGDYRRTSSITAIKNQLQWESLAERRAKARATMVYRIINHLVFTPQGFLTPLTVPSQTRGALCKLPIPPSCTDIYKNNFVASSSVLWDCLDAGITEAKTIEAFQAQLAPLRLIKWTNSTHDFILFLPCFYPCTCTFISYYSFTLLLSLACPRYRSRQWGLHDFPANYSHRYRYR